MQTPAQPSEGSYTKTGDMLKILVVDDSPSVRLHLRALLNTLGHEVVEAGDTDEGLAAFVAHAPDLVFSDIEMPGTGGYWLARQIRERERGVWTPIIFLSALSGEANLAVGIESGGDDYLVKPVHPIVLAAKIQAMRRLRGMQARLIQLSEELRVANAELQRQSERDPLTGLLNRRGLDERLAIAMRAGLRHQQPLTVMLCDVDHFKRYNDTLGHQAGDHCLKLVADLLAGVARRPHDVAARYGGEEFALILPDTPRSGAMMLARAVTRVFQAAAMPHPSSPTAAHVTLSGGITTFVPEAASRAEAVLMRADEALYVAKSKGRNRFFSFETQLDSSTGGISPTLLAGEESAAGVPRLSLTPPLKVAA